MKQEVIYIVVIKINTFNVEERNISELLYFARFTIVR
jgi:hypothetical protein